MCDTLEWQYADSVSIERAHRLRTRRNTNKPPVIVKFSTFKDKTNILQTAQAKLMDREQDTESETSYRVSEDFTSRVRSIRKTLGAYVVKARSSNKNAALSFDKLIIDDKIYKLDEEIQKPKYVAKNCSFKFSARSRVGAHGLQQYQQYHVTDDITGDTVDDWERDLQPDNNDRQNEVEGWDSVDATQ